MSTSAHDRDVPAPHMSRRWGWFVALGIGLIMLAIIAALDAAAFSAVSTVVIGASLLAGGALTAIHALMTRERSGFFLRLLAGVLAFVSGLLALNETARGVAVLTLLLTASVVAGGIVRILFAWRHRDLAAWGMMLLSGAASIVIGVMLYASLPWPGLWVLGLLIAVELFVQGGGWLWLGIALRFARDAVDRRGAIYVPGR
ncbi:MAG TPA: HdeD family acid-resistance protein [Acetobacteraceae bacterium]|nr:HdeD family acid-resistance protein [Acetobacteraceae bacterium]